MCLIIDINMYGRFIKARGSREMKPLWQWLRHRGGKVVYSPTAKLKKEWKNFPYRKDAENLQREGLVKIVPPNIVQKKENELRGKTKSDDEHIIALAMVAGAKLLLSRDADLKDDFENPNLANGNIYKRAQAQRLLTPDVCLY